MLNSAVHEILNAHKYKKYQEIHSAFSARISLNAVFLLANVKMPTIVGILTYMSRKISCSVELSRKIFITAGHDAAQLMGGGGEGGD